MTRLIVADLVALAMLGFDLYRILTTGRARKRWATTVTRERQPGRYWRRVYGDCAALAFFAVLLIAALLRPEWFR